MIRFECPTCGLEHGLCESCPDEVRERDRKKPKKEIEANEPTAARKENQMKEAKTLLGILIGGFMSLVILSGFEVVPAFGSEGTVTYAVQFASDKSPAEIILTVNAANKRLDLTSGDCGLLKPVHWRPDDNSPNQLVQVDHCGYTLPGKGKVTADIDGDGKEWFSREDSPCIAHDGNLGRISVMCEGFGGGGSSQPPTNPNPPYNPPTPPSGGNASLILVMPNDGEATMRYVASTKRLECTGGQCGSLAGSIEWHTAGGPIKVLPLDHSGYNFPCDGILTFRPMWYKKGSISGSGMRGFPDGEHLGEVEVTGMGACPATSTPPIITDSDGDGVTDQFDRCPGTPRGTQVDQYGCPLQQYDDSVGRAADGTYLLISVYRGGTVKVLQGCEGGPRTDPQLYFSGCQTTLTPEQMRTGFRAFAPTQNGVAVGMCAIGEGSPIGRDANGNPTYRSAFFPPSCFGYQNTIDSDGDGVTDQFDACPGTPYGTRVNQYGCPLGGRCGTDQERLQKIAVSAGIYGDPTQIDDREIMELMRKWIRGEKVEGYVIDNRTGAAAPFEALCDDCLALDLSANWTVGSTTYLRSLSPSETNTAIVAIAADLGSNNLRAAKAKAAALRKQLGIEEKIVQPQLSFGSVAFTISSAQVKIYDQGGRQVFDSGVVGQHGLHWNVLDLDGRRVANGVYLYVVTMYGANGQVERSEFKKIAVLR